MIEQTVQSDSARSTSFGEEHLAGLRRGLVCLAILGSLLLVAGGIFSVTLTCDRVNGSAVVTVDP